jgi:hypothetical protein
MASNSEDLLYHLFPGGYDTFQSSPDLISRRSGRRFTKISIVPHRACLRHPSMHQSPTTPTIASPFTPLAPSTPHHLTPAPPSLPPFSLSATQVSGQTFMPTTMETGLWTPYYSMRHSTFALMAPSCQISPKQPILVPSLSNAANPNRK